MAHSKVWPFVPCAHHEPELRRIATSAHACAHSLAHFPSTHHICMYLTIQQQPLIASRAAALRRLIRARRGYAQSGARCTDLKNLITEQPLEGRA
eukprot:2463886-Pleurochrysis_carterae.AAC.1